ncbi:hypothetical protein F2Q69_00056262 [Brassica cretica]|uniref:Uncharacterized protein n=1 Tax=Brassica cretica TaxID=69181 RepID=A0A8S9NA17_BRACR|nr:hypothetical protein F2Q69_00056262 [Brassica cretica]
MSTTTRLSFCVKRVDTSIGMDILPVIIKPDCCRHLLQFWDQKRLLDESIFKQEFPMVRTPVVNGEQTRRGSVGWRETVARERRGRSGGGRRRGGRGSGFMSGSMLVGVAVTDSNP